MKTAHILADIKCIGEQGDYEHQAQEFLRLTGSTLQVRYLRTGLYFGETDEKQTRDIYEFKLSRGEREYIDTFGDSLQNTWGRFARFVSSAQSYGTPERDFQKFYGTSGQGLWKKENEKLATWDYSALKPSAYSILAGMQTYDVGTFDDFLSCFGYEIDSKESYEDAQRTYEGVQNQYHKLQTLYSDKELLALATIA